MDKATPLFAKDPIVAAIVAEMEAQGLKFSYSSTSKVHWYWQFSGRLADQSKLSALLKQHTEFSKFVSARGDKKRKQAGMKLVNHAKFDKGLVQINEHLDIVSIWMYR